MCKKRKWWKIQIEPEQENKNKQLIKNKQKWWKQKQKLRKQRQNTNVIKKTWWRSRRVTIWPWSFPMWMLIFHVFEICYHFYNVPKFRLSTKTSFPRNFSFICSLIFVFCLNQQHYLNVFLVLLFYYVFLQPSLLAFWEVFLFSQFYQFIVVLLCGLLLLSVLVVLLF